MFLMEGDAPFLPEMKANPINAYGRSKLMEKKEFKKAVQYSQFSELHGWFPLMARIL